MVTKTQLMNLAIHGQDELLYFASRLTETERANSGTLKEWAPRDYLWHIAYSKQRLADDLAAARAGKEPHIRENYLAINDQTFERYHNIAWPEIEEFLHESHRAEMEQLEALNEEDFNVPGRFPALGSQPLWVRVASNVFIHLVSHIAPLYILRGEQEYANVMREHEYALVCELDDSAEWRAEAKYNMACHLALSGEGEKALEALAEALSTNTELLDWSQQDLDLISLHHDPRFLEMIERLKAERATGTPSGHSGG